jgi:[ribosomal protein S5]-alanine N-acetyltransferase
MFTLETDRFILRKIEPTDAQALFELDSDPEVMRYIGIPPVTEIEQIHNLIQQLEKQYQAFNIGRFAVVDKNSNEFLGWSGFKYYDTLFNNHIHYYDLGYRLLKKYWGKGIASETAKAWQEYGINKLGLTEMYATTDINHEASKKILTNLGFEHQEVFLDEGDPTDWFKWSI